MPEFVCLCQREMLCYSNKSICTVNRAMHAHMYIHTHSDQWKETNNFVFTSIRSSKHTHTHTYTDTCMWAFIYIHMCTRIQTQTRAHQHKIHTFVHNNEQCPHFKQEPSAATGSLLLDGDFFCSLSRQYVSHCSGWYFLTKTSMLIFTMSFRHTHREARLPKSIQRSDAKFVLSAQLKPWLKPAW